MATEVINVTIRLKRGTSEAWTRNNPVLALAEPGFEYDTGKLKIGDGKTAWNDLLYFTEVEISEEQIQQAIQEYLEKNPITTTTDTTFSQKGVAADAAAIGERCLFVGDTNEIIFNGGDADLTI